MAHQYTESLALRSKWAREGDDSTMSDGDGIDIVQPSAGSSKCSKERQKLEEELDGLREEVIDDTVAAFQTAEQARASAPRKGNVAAMETELARLVAHWPPGLAQQLGFSADALSRGLVRDFAVMAAYMSVVEAGTALESRMKGEDRNIGPADVKAACVQALGRPFEELRREVAGKMESERLGSEQQMDEGQ